MHDVKAAAAAIAMNTFDSSSISLLIGPLTRNVIQPSFREQGGVKERHGARPQQKLDRHCRVLSNAAVAPQTSQLPKWIKPQLSRAVDEAPVGNDWLHEVKYDGYRMHAHGGTHRSQ
jgi:ATP-dependent DNA ligase